MLHLNSICNFQPIYFLKPLLFVYQIPPIATKSIPPRTDNVVVVTSPVCGNLPLPVEPLVEDFDGLLGLEA